MHNILDKLDQNTKKALLGDEQVPLYKGDEFQFIRIFCQLSQKTFGRLIGKSRQFVSNLEQEKIVNPVYTLKLFEMINNFPLVLEARKRYADEWSKRRILGKNCYITSSVRIKRRGRKNIMEPRTINSRE